MIYIIIQHQIKFQNINKKLVNHQKVQMFMKKNYMKIKMLYFHQILKDLKIIYYINQKIWINYKINKQSY